MDIDFTEWLDIKEAAAQKIAIILRGLPGSGKSYTAEQLLNKYGGNPEGHLFRADNYWIPETRRRRRAGEYVGPEEEKAEYVGNFDPTLLKKAHANNLKEFKTAVDQGVTPVVADSTNTMKAHIRTFADYADLAGYDVRIEEPTSPWWKEYSPYLAEKKLYKDKLEEFVRILHGKNTHGVPLEAFRRMIDEWDHQPNLADVLGRDPTPAYKRGNQGRKMLKKDN